MILFFSLKEKHISNETDRKPHSCFFKGQICPSLCLFQSTSTSVYRNLRWGTLSSTLPLLHTAPGPLVECCIAERPMEEGHPGTHANTLPDTLKRTHRQIQLLRAITALWQVSNSKTSAVGRPSFKEKHNGKGPTFSMHLALNAEGWNLAAHAHSSTNWFLGTGVWPS